MTTPTPPTPPIPSQPVAFFLGTDNGEVLNFSAFSLPIDVLGLGGNDTIVAGLGNDSINGNAGNDQIFGIAGNESLFGGMGDDTIHGGIGNDSISGDHGNDILYGGGGANRFAIAHGGGHDWIGDFNYAAGDRLVIAAGTQYTVSSYTHQVLVTLDDGSSIGLAGVSSVPSDFIEH